ncbi:hypothetical protein [Microbacterium trichothecenolyticum]|uniref:Uncharacterized protein YacL n=1 Tax=Microbacterium trichothecenolyticum TaxID=69370 RepID=A0ABU0TY14_MICTR|nr:hypothetical protein [Microbacterium trichothecenolyticum]MDQ1124529.1 uncharacterized protein YacL [Microbacterium trichothecenolyticum]
MRKSTLWTILGVIVAIVIAWVIVNAVLSLIAFAFRVAAVAVVALIVFFVLRAVFARRDID